MNIPSDWNNDAERNYWGELQKDTAYVEYIELCNHIAYLGHPAVIQSISWFATLQPEDRRELLSDLRDLKIILERTHGCEAQIREEFMKVHAHLN